MENKQLTDYELGERDRSFRRKLAISSRILALLLILVLAYWAYIYVQYGKIASTDPCWACGYYKGKACTQVYFTQTELNAHSGEELLRRIADNNNIIEPLVKSTGDIIYKTLNWSDLNLSK